MRNLKIFRKTKSHQHLNATQSGDEHVGAPNANKSKATKLLLPFREWLSPPALVGRHLSSTSSLTEQEPALQLAPTPVLWHIPIPRELMYHIIDCYHLHDRKTLMCLSLTCRALALYCRKYLYRSIIINIRERDIGNKSTQAKLFAAITRHSPELLDFTEEFIICDKGPFMYQSRSPNVTEEEGYLCQILSRDMKNLRRFELISNMVWSRLPVQLRDTLCSMFRSPTITELSLRGVAMPMNLLGILKNLKTVDMSMTGIGPPTSHTYTFLSTGDRIQPQTLRIGDSSFNGDMARLVFAERSPFHLPSLQTIDLVITGQAVQDLGQPLQSCASLVSLKLLLRTAGAVPSTLDLSGTAASLRSLTLSADVTHMGFGSSPGPTPVARFDWLTSTLRTMHQPCHLHDITLIIRTGNLKQGLRCNWKAMDDLFEPKTWPNLKAFEIIWVTSTYNDILLHQNEAMMKVLPVTLPNLWQRDVVKMRSTSGGGPEFTFWAST